MADERSSDELEYVSRIVAAYLRNNLVSLEDIPQVIDIVRKSISGEYIEPEAIPEISRPRSPDKKLAQETILDDRLVCLECGKKLKSLKAHLHRVHKMTPSDYILKHNLPLDYPMVHPTYSQMRSKNALRSGLGQNPEEL